jgi:N-acylneuraminate cytidylyltransferase
MKVIAIIPARGGSKRLPRKNIYPIWGRPLLHWSIEAAKNSKYISEVWVSTEDPEISKVAAGAGASIHKRNPALSKDHVYKMEAVRDAVSYIEDNFHEANIYISLQANSPEITSDILDRAIESFIANDRNELISVSPNLMQNAAFRIMKHGYVFQKDLSVKCGVFVCDVHDVHTLDDIKFIESRNDSKK